MTEIQSNLYEFLVNPSNVSGDILLKVRRAWPVRGKLLALQRGIPL